jgi:AcrR family transcriptional regulator
MQDIRERILDAATRVYTEAGFRGTTTRRVAQEADVNEVTLFRHFGTKEALLKAALGRVHRPEDMPPLTQPADPVAELRAWAWHLYQRWYGGRHLICRVLGDLAEHPEIAPSICEQPHDEHAELAGYLERMRLQGLAGAEFLPDAAAGMLLGAIFTHAVWRDHFGDDLPPAETVIQHYVDLLLQSVGHRPQPAGQRARA